MKRVRIRLTYANVMSTLAVFIALGGSSYAAIKITGKNVKNSSLTYRDLKRNTLGGSRIKESRLGTVRRARNADLVGGLSAGQLLLKCPGGTLPAAGTCVEAAARSAGSYGTATRECASVGFPQRPGRRLPTHQELLALVAYDQVALAPGGELTANIYPAPDPSDPLNVLVLIGEAGTVAVTPNTFAGSKRFRCAVDPLN